MIEHIAVIMKEWMEYDKAELTRLATEVNDTTGWTYETLARQGNWIQHKDIYLAAPELAEAIALACQLLNI